MDDFTWYHSRLFFVDTGILRAAARNNEANVGLYAAVMQGGTIRRGDPVRLR